MSLPANTVLSVLDRSRIRAGHDAATALRDTVRLAQQAEQLGYHRFWVSEHHGVPGIAGSAPTVLAAGVAAATSTIRVGTGGVMLPNHRPLVVAEQFGVLDALFPGRIDMGIGRSVGFTDGVRRALGQNDHDAEEFAGQLVELLGWLSGGQTAHPRVQAYPAAGLRVPPFVLALGRSAAAAAALGLPLVIGGRDPAGMSQTVTAYREEFRPSVWRQDPYVMVTGAVAVADTESAARELLVSEAWSTAYSRTRGSFPPLVPAEQVRSLLATATAKQRALYEDALRGQVYGTEEQVEEQLARLISVIGADEVLVATSTYDRDQLADSFRRLARLAGL